MKLPSLKVSLPFIFLCWCLAGVQTHGVVILAYPAMWAVVGVFFYGLHLVTRAPAKAAASELSTSENLPATSPAPVLDDSTTDHHISAPV